MIVVAYSSILYLFQENINYNSSICIASFISCSLLVSLKINLDVEFDKERKGLK